MHEADESPKRHFSEGEENGGAANIYLFGLILSLAILFLSCTTTVYREVRTAASSGKYDSHFPDRNCSEQLENIAESVRMVSSIAYYRSYIFPREAKICSDDIHNPSLTDRASKLQYVNRSASGAATIVCSGNGLIALLTCAHVIDFPDTILAFYRDESRKVSRFVYSISIKERQSVYTAAIPGARDLDILAIDKGLDLALIGQKLETNKPILGFPVFSYPIGRAKELEWGSFVYIFGYPLGYRLITTGIVSSPNRDQYGSFLTDAVLNKGFSGGLVLAVRDGVPNFELVGIVKLIPGQQQFYLAPSRQDESIQYEPDVPYRGDAFVESRTDVDYGIALTVPSELIVEFLQKNRSALLKEGYDLQDFLERQPAKK
jgi:hypothetical protein